MKKILLGLGTITAVAAPIACVVSCMGNAEDNIPNPSPSIQAAKDAGYTQTDGVRLKATGDLDTCYYVKYTNPKTGKFVSVVVK